MAKRQKKEYTEETPELPLTPMIDCTFLLLIFFMLAARFRSEEGKLQAHLPKDRGQGKGDATKDMQEVRVKLLWYSPDGRDKYTGLDGRLILKVSTREFEWTRDMEGNPQPDWAALQQYIEQKKTAYRPPSENPSKTQPVIIDARPFVPFYWVVRALNTLVEAGIKDITFAAPEIEY